MFEDTTNTTDALTAFEEALMEVTVQVMALLPVLLIALVVFTIGLIVSPVLGNIARRLVRLAQVDKLSEKVGLSETLRNVGLNFTFSALIGRLVKWFFLIVFLLATVELLGWSTLTALLHDVVLYLPNVIIAVIIMAVGLILGQFLEQLVTKKLEMLNAPIKNGKLLAQAARWSVVTFTVLAALIQLGIAPELIQILFAGLVLALALAFGLGGREKAAELLNRIDSGR